MVLETFRGFQRESNHIKQGPFRLKCNCTSSNLKRNETITNFADRMIVERDRTLATSWIHCRHGTTLWVRVEFDWCSLELLHLAFER